MQPISKPEPDEPLVPILKLPDLEAILNQPAIISIANAHGMTTLTGKISVMYAPWQIEVEFGDYDDGIWTGKVGEFVAFAGALRAVVSVESNGKTVYKNDKIPVPYPQFDVTTQEGIEGLNRLRRDSFGEGFDYSN